MHIGSSIANGTYSLKATRPTSFILFVAWPYGQYKHQYTYLQKVGPKLAVDIQKDVRAWRGVDGVETSRRAATWIEAHKVLCELEAVAVSGKALVPSCTVLQPGGGGKAAGKASGKKDFSEAKETKGAEKGGPSAEKDFKGLVCRNTRDQGTCPYGDACRYSHDKALIAEERRKMKASGQPTVVLDPKRGDSKKEKGKGKGKGKGKDDAKKGKAKEGKEGKGGQTGSVSRVQFPDKLCPDLLKGRERKCGKE